MMKPDPLDTKTIRERLIVDMAIPFTSRARAQGYQLRGIVEAIAAEWAKYQKRHGADTANLNHQRAVECISLVHRIGRACTALVEKP